MKMMFQGDIALGVAAAPNYPEVRIQPMKDHKCAVLYTIRM